MEEEEVGNSQKILRDSNITVDTVTQVNDVIFGVSNRLSNSKNSPTIINKTTNPSKFQNELEHQT